MKIGIRDRLSEWDRTYSILHAKRLSPPIQKPYTSSNNMKKSPSKNKGNTDNSESDEVSYNSYTVRQLIKILKDRGLDTKGRKQDLITRIINDDNESENEDSEEESTTDSETSENYAEYTVIQLRGMLKKRGLDTKGLKKDLIQRLRDNDALSDSEDSSSESIVDYSRLKVAELRQLLTQRGLKTTGLKEKLIERLVRDDGR